MLTKWNLKNFKSIKDAKLTFKPLTIFAGPNSSGKSTILQSILLLSQTLSDQVPDRTIIFNGSLVKLGQFKDLLSNGSDCDTISINWECYPKKKGDYNSYLNNNVSLENLIYSKNKYKIDNNTTITCNLSFYDDSESFKSTISQFDPQISNFSMKVISQRNLLCIDNEITIEKSKNIKSKINDLNIKNEHHEINQNNLLFDVKLDRSSLDEIKYIFDTAVPFSTTLNHFLPQNIIVKIDWVYEIAKELKSILTNPSIQSINNMILLNSNFIFTDSLLELIKNKLGKNFDDLFRPKLNKLNKDITIHEWIYKINKIKLKEKRELLAQLNDWQNLHDEIANILKHDSLFLHLNFQLHDLKLPRHIKEAHDYIKIFFSTAIKYIGPLRAEPKAFYPSISYKDPTDIGTHGEMTAAIFHLYKQKKIKYIPSMTFDKTPFDIKFEFCSLEEAIADWLKYLGVAHTAYSFYNSNLGHELRVSLSDGGPDHDLTHVGVGVSQILPILVMSLLAEEDTTLIFEQPDLHLHPKVQSYLADFFLSISLSGKQCIIETHSEHIINRFRYRAAAEDDNINRIIDNLIIYSVENFEGLSKFRELKVNEFGVIKDWPKGFFDQSQLESQSIVLAALKKIKNGR